MTKIQGLVEPILNPLVNVDKTGTFDKIADPLLILEEKLPGVSDLAGKKITFLDMAEAFVGEASGADTVRKVLKIYKGMQAVATTFANANEDGILLAASCEFKPGKDADCTGGVTDFLQEDGRRRLVELSREMEVVFQTYDASGNQISPAHRFLSTNCPLFDGDDCSESCDCTGTAKAKCLARQLRCKARNTEALSFPFMSDPASVLGLFSGNDIELLEFHPPVSRDCYKDG